MITTLALICTGTTLCLPFDGETLRPLSGTAPQVQALSTLQAGSSRLLGVGSEAGQEKRGEDEAKENDDEERKEKEDEKQAEALRKLLKLLKENKTVQAGLSLGWRVVPVREERQFRDVAVGPGGLLVFDEGDASSVVLSGVVTAYPFNGRWKMFGFVANINIADFTADSVGIFNKSIEGGLGFAFRLNQDFGIAVTVERAFSRRLRRGLDLSRPILGGDGQPIKSIDRADGSYFYDDNVTAVSVKWVYVF